ncbi:MAG: DUF3800 domain-containing protein [Rhodospirillales bacterium]|nr:DUF3800 domain-containing protein [Rhodospirillales bacterium]
MLVFIDESGDPGFKIAKGSDPVFALGMVIFKTAAAAGMVGEVIQLLREEIGHKPEFKFSKCSGSVRDAFFRRVAGCDFSVRALVVNKEVIYSGQLRTDSNAFYSYFVKQLMNFDAGALKDAKVRIDGSGSRDFQRALGSYLRRELKGKIRDLKMIDSHRDALMQLADMCVGAIARSYRDRDEPARWRNMLRRRIDNVWDFK